ncbi:MAG TPA: glutamine amidotransferase [Candidatus Acidoferrales bacterium]|nr:glutamine amidotransferase [Candidatus Acidoferrales bacterium]
MKDFYLISNLPGWIIALASLAVVLLLAQQFIGLKKRLATGPSTLLVLLRTCVYGVLIFFLFGPAIIENRTAKLRPPLTVLIDTSESMAFPANPQPLPEGKPAKSRIDVVKETLLAGKEPLIQRLSREYDLRLYRLGTSLEPISPEAVGQLKAVDQGSRILELLQAAAKDAPPQSSLMIFTDGITNGDKKTLDGSPALPIPVFAVGVGETQGFTDVRIADVRAPEFAFRGREFKVDLTVQASGLKGKAIPLYFNRGKNLITSQTITVDADPFEKKVTLSFTPRDLGPHSFNVVIPNQPGEQITGNNQKEFKVDVQRDKLRILTLSGSPSWNYRFLRMALKQDPLIELVSFVFLRTPTDTVDVPENQLSLIPFPIDDIFLEELKNFDVVLFDDFSHRAYFNPVYLDKVRDFVRDGGGFGMFGGSRAFDAGGYADSSLKEVLPVELDGKGTYQTQAALRPALTASGKAHPITRLVPDPKANEEAWNKMPQLTAYNRVRAARGETLLSGADGSGENVPLLTVGRFGKGRTMALMSDEAWRWNFIAVGNRETPQNHLKLIRQAVRWLAQEPSFEQVQIRPVPLSRPGEKVAIKVRVLKDDFTPAAQASVQLRVTGPDGDPMIIASTADSEEGQYTGDLTPTKEGSYRVEAEATLAGKTLGKANTSFSVAFPYGENDDGRPRPDLLKKVAETSHGVFFSINDWNDKTFGQIESKLESQAPSQIVERHQTRLWSTFWPFALVLVLLSVEWWMRRTWGLI